MGKKSGSGSRIRLRDPDQGWTTRIIFPKAKKPFFGLKILSFFYEDPGWKKNSYPASEMEKSRVRDEYPGSATLLISHQFEPLLRSHGILVLIRIRGSISRTNGSGSCYFRHLPSDPDPWISTLDYGSCSFCQRLWRNQQKTSFLLISLLIMSTFTPFFKDSKSVRCPNTVETDPEHWPWRSSKHEECQGCIDHKYINE